MEALEVTGAGEEPLDGGDDRSGIREAADPGQPRGERAHLRLDELVAERAQRLDVPLRGGMGPHPGVHGRRQDQRGASGAGDRGHRVVDQAGRQLRQHVGGGRRDDDRIGPFSQLDVLDLLLRVELHDIGHHRAVGERSERERGDEAGRRGCHRHVHDRPGLDEPPHDEHRLVGRDAAGDPNDDAAAGERPQRLAHRARSLRAATRNWCASRMPCRVRSGSIASIPGTSLSHGSYV